MATKYQIYGRASGDSSAKAPTFKIPDGYVDESEFLFEMRAMFTDDVGSDQLNRTAALEDLRFFIGQQWDDAVVARRTKAKKPVLTINRLPAFVSQILGSRRLNETDIKVAADAGGYEGVAQVREGLIRSIQKVSKADFAYDTALAGAVCCGIGNFTVDLEYSSDNPRGEQDIRFNAVPDHLAVVWDRNMTDQTGGDATRCFTVESMSVQDFYQAYPWAQPSDVAIDYAMRGDLRSTGWVSASDVRVVAYWRMRKHKRTIAEMANGSVVDVTDVEDLQKLTGIAQWPDGSPIMRETMRPYAQMYICSGLQVLEGPYDLPISRIPVYRVPGWEMRVGEWRHRWGLIRFLKDSQKLHNYSRSVIAEKLTQTPRAVWVAKDGAVAGREDKWRNSHLSDDPLLIWNGAAGDPPVRAMPAQVEDGLMSQAEMTSQDLKDVSNIHEANLGMPSNEVSQVAIMARQRVSDTGTIIYHDNLAKAQEAAGRTCNELIPLVYDTPRVIKIMGSDGKTYAQAINDFNDPKSIDITIGKYDVTCGVGPSYATKRIEQAASMLGMSQSMPQIFSLAGDLLVAAQDWPDADKIAERIKNSLPPGVLQPSEMSPQQQQAMQQGQQEAAQQKQIGQAGAIATYIKTQSDAMLSAARARNFAAEAANQPQKMQLDATRAASEVTHTAYQDRLDAIRIAHGG